MPLQTRAKHERPRPHTNHQIDTVACSVCGTWRPEGDKSLQCACGSVFVNSSEMRWLADQDDVAGQTERAARRRALANKMRGASDATATPDTERGDL